MFFVYLLKCYNKLGKFKIYCGYTNSLERRLETHRSGKGAKFTRMYHHKIELVYWEEYKTKNEAMIRESFIKRIFSRAQKLALIKSFKTDPS